MLSGCSSEAAQSGADHEASSASSTSTTGEVAATTTQTVDESTQPDSTFPDEAVFPVVRRKTGCLAGELDEKPTPWVDCDDPHQFEIYREALVAPSVTSSFDEGLIVEYAEEVCAISLDAYVPDNDERGIDFTFVHPTEDSGTSPADPDRVITCLLFDEDGPIVGRAG